MLPLYFIENNCLIRAEVFRLKMFYKQKMCAAD